MADRNVHYEAAFEDYLRRRGTSCVCVDEAKRAVFSSANIKSFDFIVHSSKGPNLLVDVKGRKFPDLSKHSAGRKGGRAWENWVTREDVDSLGKWQTVFGADFVATLVFAYWLQGPPHKTPFTDVHLFRDKHYAFVAISLSEYILAAHPRSARWQTITINGQQFADCVRDISAFL